MTADPLPLSVWTTAQVPAGHQRKGRYLPASMNHPAKMLPALARAAVEAYSAPGDLVVDPMCGIGTTLVEASHLGRRSFGIEQEPRWAELARANLAHAQARGAGGPGKVVTGDGRDVARLLPARQRGTVALVVTSPPYGPSIHPAQVSRDRTGPVKKRHERYSDNPANLGHVRVPELLVALGEIVAGCADILRPGGLMVMTARPWRRDGELVDFPGLLEQIGEAQGLVLYERNVALLAAAREGRFVPRPSFLQMVQVRRARALGRPQLLIAHEDVLVFRRP